MEPIEKTEKLDHRHYIALLNNGWQQLPMKKFCECTGILEKCYMPAKNQTDGATRPCNDCRPTSKMSIPT